MHKLFDLILTKRNVFVMIIFNEDKTRLNCFKTCKIIISQIEMFQLTFVFRPSLIASGLKEKNYRKKEKLIIERKIFNSRFLSRQASPLSRVVNLSLKFIAFQWVECT